MGKTYDQRGRPQQPEMEGPDERAVEALKALPRDMIVMQMVNDQIMSRAVTSPINYPAVLADIEAQLDACPALVEEAMYDKPVGEDYETGEQKWAMGLSVQAAQVLAAAIGLNQTIESILPMEGDSDKAIVSATFVNFRSGTIRQKSVTVSKRFKKRDGSIGVTNEDRFLNVVCAARQSIVTREATIRSFPPGLVLEFERKVMARLGALLTPEAIAKLMEYFASLGISQKQVEALIGSKVERFRDIDRRRLLGVANAVKTGESSLAEIFDVPGDPATQARVDALRDKLAKGAQKPPSTPQATTPPQQPASDAAALAKAQAEAAARNAAAKATQAQAPVPTTPPAKTEEFPPVQQPAATEPPPMEGPPSQLTSSEQRELFVESAGRCASLDEVGVLEEQLGTVTLEQADYSASVKAINAAKRRLSAKKGA